MATNITLKISAYCGADCVMCPHKQYEYKNQFITSELFIKAVDECASIGIKIFNR